MLKTAISRIGLVASATAAIGCGIPTQTTKVTGDPLPVTIRMEPATPGVGQPADLMITSPGADSIIFASENGLDRYWTTHDTLRVRIDPNFGESGPTERYATRFEGQLLSRLMKPAEIKVCRQGVLPDDLSRDSGRAARGEPSDGRDHCRVQHDLRPAVPGRLAQRGAVS